ncbi:ankyrin repeat domain-containing protein [Candidatus Mesenet endosymbiont of Phosphuga atrata]|uniref:ankyrin repeat domain-containing protein n=1 Tax=Candidatus Mesenet endosymbiont of Phosphuga atrata TaxID=3066221 RepID=UPI0030D3FC96
MRLLDNVKKRNFTQVQKFFLQSTNEQKKKDIEGKTALMHAVIDGNLKMVKLLCQKIDITAFNAQDNNGMTVVMHAAKLGHRDILKFFCNDIPEKIIAHPEKHDFSYATENDTSGYNALMLAIANGHTNCLKYLYYKEIQHIINHQDKDGKTPIMLVLDEMATANLAYSGGDIENAKQLLHEFFQVVQTVFREKDERNEEHFQMLKEIFNEENEKHDNKLNLTIQDEDERNVFAYAKEAKCEQELLDFIASIPMDATNLDLSVYKLPNGKQCFKNVKCSEDDLTSWIIFNPALEVFLKSNKRDINLSRSFR